MKLGMEIKISRRYSPIIDQGLLDDGSVSFFAHHPWFPGVNADGGTYDAAAEAWSEAMDMYLEHCRQHNLPIPAPNSTHIDVVIGSDRRTKAAKTEEVAVYVGGVAAAC